MCFIFSLIPATSATVVGFIVLYCANKSAGGLRTFGRILAIWVFLIAVFIPIMGLYVTLSGLCPMEQMMQATPPL